MIVFMIEFLVACMTYTYFMTYVMLDFSYTRVGTSIHEMAINTSCCKINLGTHGYVILFFLHPPTHCASKVTIPTFYGKPYIFNRNDDPKIFEKLGSNIMS